MGASEIQILMPWTLKSLLQKQLPTGNEDLRPGLHLAFFTSFYSIIFFFLFISDVHETVPGNSFG